MTPTEHASHEDVMEKNTKTIAELRAELATAQKAAKISEAAITFVHCFRANTAPNDPADKCGWLFGHMEWETLCHTVDEATVETPVIAVGDGK